MSNTDSPHAPSIQKPDSGSLEVRKKPLLKRFGELNARLIAFLIGFSCFSCSFVSRILLLSLWQRRKPWEDAPIKDELMQELFYVDPPYGRHRTINANGHDFHYVEGGNPNGELVLFLHGFPQCWYTWRHQLNEFHNDNRYHLVAIDLKGYGTSYKPTDLDEFRPNQQVADIEGIIRALGHERCILVGHDWGGIIAWTIASRRPEIVHRLVIFNAPYQAHMSQNLAFKNPELPKSLIFRQMARLYYTFILKLPGPFPSIWLNWRGKEMLRDIVSDGGSNSEHDVDAYSTAFGIPGVLFGATAYFKVGASTTKAQLDMPTLVIWGQDDVALDDKVCLSGLEDYVSDLQVCVMDRTSHFSPENNPERVNPILKQFFEVGNEKLENQE